MFIYLMINTLKLKPKTIYYSKGVCVHANIK